MRWMMIMMGVAQMLAGVVQARADSISNDTQALRIYGSGAHMLVAHDASLNLSGAATLEYWMRFDGTESTPGGELVKRGDGNKGYGMGVNPGSRAVGSIFGQHSNLVSSPPSFGSGWHHVAWTFDGTTSTLYFDGQVLQTQSYTGTIGQTASDLIFGIGVEGDGTWNSATAQGWYDELRVWNVARSASQIFASYNVSLAGNESGLVGYWNFNDGTAADLSAYGNNGQLVNGAYIGAVPEPGTLILVGLGCCALTTRRRRRSIGVGSACRDE